MGHGQPTKEEEERHDREQRKQAARFAQIKMDAQRFDGLKSVATSAHAALTDALPYVGSVELKDKMRDVIKRLNLWGAHP